MLRLASLSVIMKIMGACGMPLKVLHGGLRPTFPTEERGMPSLHGNYGTEEKIKVKFGWIYILILCSIVFREF